MAEENDLNQEDKTEEPTQQRIEEFRSEGHVAQSREITAFFVLLACLGTMYFAGPYLAQDLFDIFRSMLSD